MNTIISGTNRQNSNTLLLSQYYQRELLAQGVECNLISLENLPINLIDSDMYGKRSPEFQKIQDIISATQKFIFVIPEYNGSFPGVLKTFIDCCSYPESFLDKKAALVGVSSGKYGNIRGVDHFTGVCHYIGLNVLPMRTHISYIRQEFDEQKNLFKEDTLKFTKLQMEKFKNF